MDLPMEDLNEIISTAEKAQKAWQKVSLKKERKFSKTSHSY
jgi:hypothetical protein